MAKVPGINHNSHKRHFIYDYELEKQMESEDKEQLRQDIELNKRYLASQGCGIHKTTQLRLNIAKELLIALMGNKDLYPNGATLSDMIDDSIKVTDLLLERIEK